MIITPCSNLSSEINEIGNNLNYNLGDWVKTIDGYGQIIKIGYTYFEECDQPKLVYNKKSGDIMYTYAIVKLLCDKKGKIIRKNLIRAQSLFQISPIDSAGKEFVEKIQKNKIEIYRRYIYYSDKVDIYNHVSLIYKTDDMNLNEIEKKIWDINKNIIPNFIYPDFKKEFRKQDLPFKLTDSIHPQSDYRLSDIFRLLFINPMFKTVGNKKVFIWVMLVRYDKEHHKLKWPMNIRRNLGHLL